MVARDGKVRRRVPCITTEDDKAYNNNPQFLIVLRNRSAEATEVVTLLLLLLSPSQQNQLDLNYSDNCCHQDLVHSIQTDL